MPRSARNRLLTLATLGALGLLGTFSALSAQAPTPPPPPEPVAAVPASEPPGSSSPPPAPSAPSTTPAQAAPGAPTSEAPIHLPANCSCVKGGGTLEHGLEVAQEIWSGEVVGEQMLGLELRRFTILVSTSWKSDLTTVRAETAAGACGARLELGRSYLFYGTWKADRSALLIGACMRYLPSEEAVADLARLGKAPYEHPITAERRQSVIEGAEQAKKSQGCAAHVQDAPSFFLPMSRNVKFERQRILDDAGTELGSFHGTWTPRRGAEGTFVELLVDNHTACTLHLRLEARAAGQPIHLSRTDEFIPGGDHFRVRFAVSPPANWNADVELKATWEVMATGG